MESTTRHDISRRTLARGAAWTAPVVLASVAAPAFAASVSCLSGSDPLNQGLGKTVTGLVFLPSTVQANLTFAATRADGTAYTVPGETGLMRSTDYQPSWNYVKLHHAAGMKQGDTITMTIALTQTVNNLTLTITDIDKYVGQWIDEVTIEPAGFVALPGPNVVGSGAVGTPFASKVDDNIHTDAGDLKLTWPFPVNQVRIKYRAADALNTSGIGQHIGVGRFAFSNC